MSFLARLLGKRDDDRAIARPLWHGVVALARKPDWYAKLGVADTLPGRFDAITMVLALVMLRMEREDALIEPSVRLTELFVEDMDGQLRESGVGDLGVGKKMGKLMGVLGGRIGAYRAALAESGDAALADALTRNVTLIEGRDAAGLAREVRELADRIDALSADDLLAARLPA